MATWCGEFISEFWRVSGPPRPTWGNGIIGPRDGVYRWNQESYEECKRWAIQLGRRDHPELEFDNGQPGPDPDPDPGPEPPEYRPPGHKELRAMARADLRAQELAARGWKAAKIANDPGDEHNKGYKHHRTEADELRWERER